MKLDHCVIVNSRLAAVIADDDANISPQSFRRFVISSTLLVDLTDCGRLNLDYRGTSPSKLIGKNWLVVAHVGWVF